MSGRLTKHSLDRARAAPLLREVMPIADGEPVSAIGWRDVRGRVRRVLAEYANGWRIELRLSADGRLTTCAASLHMEIAGTK